MENINIEKMTLEDLEEIKAILETDFDDFWNYNILKNEIKNENAIYVVAKKRSNNEIVGFAGITAILDVAELNNIVVKKSYRRNGISKLLLNSLIEEAKKNNCKQINLEVFEKNITAINLYKKFDFIQVGMRNNYYNSGNALLFTKTL